MDKRSLYDGLNQLEGELESSLRRLGEMKLALQEIVEKNTTLELENQKLREHLRELDRVDTPAEKVTHGLSKSRLNLEKIYEEGFHVCYDLYGSRREYDEPCAFCLEVIYRESGK
ncbi:MAG: DNA replication initiation control protein YabA [Enterococcus sp.]